VAQVINYATQHVEPHGWRISLGLAGVPAAILVVGCMFIPETPNSLVCAPAPVLGGACVRGVQPASRVC
jgi:MFS transporter, SP family, sugar:H+ symporter